MYRLRVYLLPHQSVDVEHPSIVDGIPTVVHSPEDKEPGLKMAVVFLDLLRGREEGRRAGKPGQVRPGELGVPGRESSTRQVVSPTTDARWIREGAGSVEGAFERPWLLRSHR